MKETTERYSVNGNCGGLYSFYTGVEYYLLVMGAINNDFDPLDFPVSEKQNPSPHRKISSRRD